MLSLPKAAILTLAAVVAVVLFSVLVQRGTGDAGDGATGGSQRHAGQQGVLDTALVRRLPVPIAAYLADCGRERRLPEEPVAFQAELRGCIRRMTAAMEVIVDSATTSRSLLTRQIEAHRHTTARILSRQGESLQTAPTQEMLESAGLVLVALWEARYRAVPGLASEVATVRREVRRLEHAEPLFYQRESVEEVLDRTGAVLLLMAREELQEVDAG